MKGNGAARQELPAAGGMGLVVPVSAHRVGVAHPPGSPQPLVCLELSGDDGKAVRYGITPAKAVAIAGELLRRADQPPFAWSRELRANAARIFEGLAERARGRTP